MKLKFAIKTLAISVLLITTFSSCENEEINEPTNAIEISSKASVTLQWDGNPATFANALTQAVRNAGAGGTVTLPNRTYRTDRSVFLPTDIPNVTITGATNRDNVRIVATRTFNTPGLVVTGANGTIYRNMTVDWAGLDNNSVAVSSQGKSGVQAYNMRFANAGQGFGTPDNRTGLPIDFLVASNCEFRNCARGILFNRNFSSTPVSSIGKVIIRNCQFLGDQLAGISIDCGNDGADGREDLRILPRAAEAMGIVTDMNGMEISGCFFQKAQNFNLAFAKVKNIQVFGNTFEGTTGAVRFTEAINIEHESNGISINGNNISNFAQGDHNYISVITFRDYGNAPLFENGCRRIFINNNTFSGNCGSGIIGEEAQFVDIFDNNFNFPLPVGDHVNFFRSDRGNRNINVDRNTNTPTNKIRITTF
ncbi:hypothetical protein AWE51_17540 [Aquimarina aggregata]|uniref:Right handed beta helix domain-containing protein n=1 Tax=Aquimarina aggregata TaxID=1642818 RepID=A0A162X0Y6_9FLAO|nr:hypothetical protein [Aquimarina aggregata]KZS38359.1 hypothetical protein AWE51_17540 [Aquimarina aggregata]